MAWRAIAKAAPRQNQRLMRGGKHEINGVAMAGVASVKAYHHRKEIMAAKTSIMAIGAAWQKQ